MVLNLCGEVESGDMDLRDPKKGTGNEEGKREYSCGKNAWHYLMEYCSNGSIHGVRFLSEKRTCIEKLFWAVSLSVSLYFCIILIMAAYLRWQNSPVIVSFATKETSAWMVPFPAVTICPESKTRPSVFNYTRLLHRKQDGHPLTAEEERKFGFLSFVCDEHNFEYEGEKFTQGHELIDFLEEVQPRFFEDTISDCKFLEKRYNCTELWVPIVSDVGICYTFNIVDRSQLLSDIVVHYKKYHQTTVANDWSVESGYVKTADIDAYPRRALFAGIPNALEATLRIDESDLDYTCGTSIKGFKVQLSHPQRMPRVRQQHFVVPPDRVAKAGIAPDILSTSESVQNYDPKKRNCHLPSERALKYFKVYTQNNCVIECQANFTYSRCGCVTFFMPREASVPICGASSWSCIKKANSLLRLASIKRNIDANLNRKSDPEIADLPNCQCLPICTAMYYNIENHQAAWDWRTTYKHNRNNHSDIDNKKVHRSILQVFFKGNQFITSERNELYGLTEFLANVGGLLGLFIGFSALSVVEIIYYLTLRIGCNVRMFGWGNWAGRTD